MKTSQKMGLKHPEELGENIPRSGIKTSQKIGLKRPKELDENIPRNGKMSKRENGKIPPSPGGSGRGTGKSKIFVSLGLRKHERALINSSLTIINNYH